MQIQKGEVRKKRQKSNAKNRRTTLHIKKDKDKQGTNKKQQHNTVLRTIHYKMTKTSTNAKTSFRYKYY